MSVVDSSRSTLLTPRAVPFAAPGETSLKGAFHPALQIGCAVGGLLPGSLNTDETQLVTRHFGVLTAENCMKPAFIQPERGRFDFEAPDALVAFAEERNMAVVGHTLVWHGATPSWMYPPGVERGDALRQLREHIHTVVEHYRGRIQGWDVVNEALTDGDGYLRETPCLAALGSEYLERAFQFAREADPAVELYYNDYNIELPAKRERTLRLLDQLAAAGVAPDGVGIQGHWVLDQVPFAEIETAIDLFAARGLKVMITELDLDVVQRRNAGADVSERFNAAACDPYVAGCPREVLDRQAAQYARLFEIFLAKGVSRVSFWGPHDGLSWLNSWPSRRTNHALLFDRQSHPKPAFDSVIAVSQRQR